MARDARLLTAKQAVSLRNLALAFWVACLLLIVVPAVFGSSGSTRSAPFTRPVEPPGPHPATPLKQ